MIVLGLDLGQAADYSALTVLDYSKTKLDGPYKIGDTVDTAYKKSFDVPKVLRYPLQTSYPDIVASLQQFVASDKFRIPNQEGKYKTYVLVVDGTGVGRPVVDLLRKARLNVVPVTITAGIEAKYDVEAGYWHCGKSMLISNVLTMMQTGELEFAAGLEYADILKKEMANFKMKIALSGSVTFEAWREADHDDLVLSLALACWYAKFYGYAGEREKPKRSPTHPLYKLKNV